MVSRRKFLGGAAAVAALGPSSSEPGFATGGIVSPPIGHLVGEAGCEPIVFSVGSRVEALAKSMRMGRISPAVARRLINRDHI